MQKAAKNDILKPKAEKILEDIDSGKIKMTRYKTPNEYIKHIEDALSD